MDVEYGEGARLGREGAVYAAKAIEQRVGESRPDAPRAAPLSGDPRERERWVVQAGVRRSATPRGLGRHATSTADRISMAVQGGRRARERAQGRPAATAHVALASQAAAPAIGCACAQPRETAVRPLQRPTWDSSGWRRVASVIAPVNRPTTRHARTILEEDARKGGKGLDTQCLRRSLARGGPLPTALSTGTVDNSHEAARNRKAPSTRLGAKSGLTGRGRICRARRGNCRRPPGRGQSMPVQTMPRVLAAGPEASGCPSSWPRPGRPPHPS